MDFVCAWRDMGASLVEVVEEESVSEEARSDEPLPPRNWKKKTNSLFSRPFLYLIHADAASLPDNDDTCQSGSLEATRRALLDTPNWARLPGPSVEREHSPSETSSESHPTSQKTVRLIAAKRPLKTLFPVAQRRDIHGSSTPPVPFGGQRLRTGSPKLGSLSERLSKPFSAPCRTPFYEHIPDIVQEHKRPKKPRLYFTPAKEEPRCSSEKSGPAESSGGSDRDETDEILHFSEDEVASSRGTFDETDVEGKKA
jgi:hypothetical protein